ncbi:MAG: hypothetical protein RIB98_13910 [Acidimicrobiales bacterium]
MAEGVRRVAVWTTGNVVRQAVRAILARPDLELVGAYAYSAEKAGVDVGTLCGLDHELAVVATADVGELLDLGLDAIVYAPLHLDVDELERILGAGVNVVASAEFMTGATLDPGQRDRLESACSAGDATLFGSGMNPGYAQLFAAIGAGITSGVERVVVSESVDVSDYVTDANFESAGWARPADDPGHADDVRNGTQVFAEGVETLGRLLGVVFDEIRCDVAFAHAIDDVEVPGLRIPAGHVAGMDVHWIGVVGGEDVVEIRQRWLASERIDPPWKVEHGYIVEVAGDPNVRIKMDIWPTAEDMAHLDKDTMHSIGMRITAVPVVNAIPAVCDAVSGIVTYADLPVITSPLRRR